MTLTSFFDVPFGVIYVVYGVALALLLAYFFVIVLIEGIVLWKLKWAKFRKSLLASLLVNVTSTIVGVILYFGINRSIGTLEDLLTQNLPGLIIVSWLITIPIEGGVLVLLNRSDWRLSIRLAFIINFVSYILNAVVLWVISNNI
jgi:hypothetical protein